MFRRLIDFLTPRVRLPASQTAMRKLFNRILLVIGIILVLTIIVLYYEQPHLSFGEAVLSGIALLMQAESFGIRTENLSFAGKTLVILLLISGTALLAVLLGFVTERLLSLHAEYLQGKRGVLPMKNHIVIIGLGQVGFRTWQAIRKFDESIPMLVIEHNEANRNLTHVRRAGTEVIVEDPRNDGVLERAFVHDAITIICATDDDLANLECALSARELNPEIRVVMRMYDQRLASKVRNGFRIDACFSSSLLAAPAFAAAAFDGTIINSYDLGTYRVVTARITVQADSPLIGQRLAEIMQQHHCAVLKHVGPEGESSLYPSREIVVAAGDALLINSSFPTLKELKALAGDSST